MAKRIPKYNPAFLSGDELVDAFVVRHAELEMIVQVIRENIGESNQHFLVIGPRGIGKTMLVLRVAEEVRRDEVLRERWYPLVFSEESYPVTSPGEFWLEALFHLGEQTMDSRWKQTHAELVKEQDEGRLRDRALAQLMDFADGQGKRILLVVENFNTLVGERISDDDAWTLRHTLLNERRLMLLATATNRFEEVENAGKAMFELFRTLKLEPLEQEECKELWSSITGKEVTIERIRPIQILTGGSPRLMRIISSFASKMSLRDLMDDLMYLVDEHTEYFKSHLECLPPTERKAYLALAELWDPATAKQVGGAARLGVSNASSLLGRLVDRGAVVCVDGKGRRKQYQIAERMYNIYYLMRRRGTPSARVRAVVNFMVVFYGREELATVAGRIAEEASGLGTELRRDHYLAYEGIMERVAGLGLRDALLEATPKGFFDMPDIPSSIRRLVEPEGREREALELVAKAGAAWESGKTAGDAEKLWRKATEIAPKSARTWAQLGQLLHLKLERYDEAEEAYRKALELEPENGAVLNKLTILLLTKLERPGEAVKLVQEKVGQYKENAGIRNSVAWAFCEHAPLELLADAEKWAQEAIELEPEDGNYRHTLGSILCRLGKVEEALEEGRKYLEDAAVVEKTVNDGIDLFVELAAKGVGKEAVKILEESASAEALEPLVVGLRMYLGDDVHVATEIMEIGKDVVKRIEERRDELEAAGGMSE